MKEIWLSASIFIWKHLQCLPSIPSDPNSFGTMSRWIHPARRTMLKNVMILELLFDSVTSVAAITIVVRFNDTKQSMRWPSPWVIPAHDGHCWHPRWPLLWDDLLSLKIGLVTRSNSGISHSIAVYTEHMYHSQRNSKHWKRRIPTPSYVDSVVDVDVTTTRKYDDNSSFSISNKVLFVLLYNSSN